MDRLVLKRYRKQQRRKRVRKKIIGSAITPRISVYKSNRHFYLQAIDDQVGATITSAGTCEAVHANEAKVIKNRIELSQTLGERLAKRLLEKKIVRAVYDCNGNRYHGSIKTIADSIRAAGVQI